MGSRKNTLTIKYDMLDFNITAKNASGFDTSIAFNIRMNLDPNYISRNKISGPFYFYIKNFNDGNKDLSELHYNRLLKRPAQ